MFRKIISLYNFTSPNGHLFFISKPLLNMLSNITDYFIMEATFLLSLAPQPSLGLGLLHKIQMNFFEASQQFSFLQGRVVSPTPNPHPGGPGLCIIYIPQRQGGYPF
jgi:hypothetical protein